LTSIERSDIILHMDNKKITSLKVWKQTQEKIKLIAAIERKTMFEVLDKMADERLKQLEKEDKGDANEKL